jgi:hypothetical protein
MQIQRRAEQRREEKRREEENRTDEQRGGECAEEVVDEDDNDKNDHIPQTRTSPCGDKKKKEGNGKVEQEYQETTSWYHIVDITSRLS